MKIARSFFCCVFSFLATAGFANTYTVINTNDAGTGSLRVAISSAVTHPGGDIITFNIPTTDAGFNASQGTWTITLVSNLTQLYGSTANATIIDGTTQTTTNGDTNPYGPEIVIDGVNYSLDYGFQIVNAANCVIKGVTIKRFIEGIQIYGTLAKNNVISGNYIGTNFNATDSAGNNIGIEIIGGPKHNTVGGLTVADRNIVSGNRHIGIRLANADSNNVFGNFVGVNRTGTVALKNYDGVSIEGTAKANNIGGSAMGMRNIISGNDAYGVPIIGTDAKYNKIMGNYIGTDVSGTSAIPNTYGVLFDDQSSYNICGGDSVSFRNIISGNSGYGVFVYNYHTNHNIVRNNYIGTDKTGTAAVANGNGIVVDGGPVFNIIDENVISGNAQQGIVIHSTWTDSNTVTRNYIGTDYTGLLPLGNVIDGIRIAEGPKYNFIGGSINEANIIAFNGGSGVFLMSPDDLYNKISCNSIHNNTGLGIDLFPVGVNPNDAGDVDSGPNEMMNFPVIISAEYWTYNSLTIVQGAIDTQNPQNVNIEIFIADADSIAYGQGMTYIGCTNPDALGNWGVSLNGINAGDVITTTATDIAGNTSEFSLNKLVGTYTGITENTTDADVSIFPNPASSILNFKTTDPLKWDNLTLKNAGGQEVYRLNISGKSSAIVDLSHIPSGSFIAEIAGKSGKVNKGIIIKK